MPVSATESRASPGAAPTSHADLSARTRCTAARSRRGCAAPAGGAPSRRRRRRAAPGAAASSVISRSAAACARSRTVSAAKRAEVEVGEGERHAAALAARQEEQVLRDPRQVPDLEDRVADRLAVLLGRPVLLERHLERAAQHRQRRAQLVRDVGDELLLLLLGGGQRVEPRVQALGDRRARPARGRRTGSAPAAATSVSSSRAFSFASDGSAASRRAGERNRPKRLTAGPSAPPGRRRPRARGSRRRAPSGSASPGRPRRSSCAAR